MTAISPSEQTQSTNEPVLGLLAATDVESAKSASAPLLQTPVAAKLAKHPKLSQAFALWWNRANDPGEPERLAALALLWRLTSLSAMNTHRRKLNSMIENGLVPGLPALSKLIDPKDRKAVAEALLAAPIDSWIGNYAAAAIVSDPDPKSDSRDGMCAVLLRQTGNLGEAFGQLSEAFADVKIQQHDPAAGRARRTAWILRSLRAPLYEDEVVEAFEDFGGYFAHFVSTALGSAHTMDRDALVDGVREIVLTLNTIVRLHGLRLATHAKTYAVVESIRRKFQTTDWPEKIVAPVEKLSHRVVEALLVLARQGIADAGLRRVYVALLGNVVATRRLQRLVSSNEGLDAEISYWLETGQTRDRMDSAAAIEETATALVDLDLSRALREAFMADNPADSGGDPAAALRRMARGVREAARKRGIVLRGSPGDVVDFSPLEHEADSSVLGHRKVTLVTPLVERVASGRSIAILIKAQVRADGEG